MSGERASDRFAAALAQGEGGGMQLAGRCLDNLGSLPRGANLGILYLSDRLAGEVPRILALLRAKTGIADWVGSVAVGVLAGGEEVVDTPALAVLVGALPEDGFRIFGPVSGGDRLIADHGPWLERTQPMLALVHGDPRQRATLAAVEDVPLKTSVFLAGGLTASRGEAVQIAGDAVSGGLSGVLFSAGVEAVTALAQGCAPLGPPRRVTEAKGHVVLALDGRPALSALKEDIGELMARDLKRAAGVVHVGLPVRGSDRGDYVVRNLLGIDPAHGALAVAADLEPGDPILFCRRDPSGAAAQLERTLQQLAQRTAGLQPQAGVYACCVARGAALFGAPGRELAMIRAALGDFPLVGFLADGEISHNRLYAYTGVLTLFL